MSRLHSQKRLLGRLSRGRSSTRLLRGVAERASRASWSPGSSRRSRGRAVERSCGRPMDLRWRRLDGPAFAAEALTTTRSADALRCGRRRPRQAGAARGAVFESMRPVEGRLRAFALRLRCSALSSSPAQQRLRAQFKLSIRRVCTSLVIYVAIYAGPRRACDHLSNRDVASKFVLPQIQRALSDTSPERRRTPGAALA